MTSKFETLQKRFGPTLNREQARHIRDRLRRSEPTDKVAKAERRREREKTGRRQELQRRIDLCFSGDGTYSDRSFVASRIGEFERPLGGEGNGRISITKVEF